VAPHLPRHADPELLSLLRAAAANAEQCSTLLHDLTANYPERDSLADQIVVCEHEGDRITHDLLYRLNAVPRRRRPFDLADGHALATAIDDIVDFAEETSDSMRLYAVQAPMVQAEQLADVLVRASQQVGNALRELVDGKEYGQRLVEIHELENEGDRVVRGAVAALFVDGIDPLVVIRWKDIFESLEQAIDACEHVGHLLEGIAMRRRRRS
jgi:uncharacterized protein Yka (UPF0111/DUF47 family)